MAITSCAMRSAAGRDVLRGGHVRRVRCRTSGMARLESRAPAGDEPGGEAYAFLVGAPVFNTGEGRYPVLVGSIPIRLR